MIYAEDVDYTKVLNALPGQYQQQPAPAYRQPAQGQGYQQQLKQEYNPGQF